MILRKTIFDNKRYKNFSRPMTDEETLSFIYRFNLPSEVKEFSVCLRRSDLSIIRDEENSVKTDWALLKNFACPHCPLDQTVNEYCPLALNLYHLIMEFNHFASYDDVEVEVETYSRNFTKSTALQSGVSSLLGILMVSSGCPIMGKLKPLLYSHLPFATLDETQLRVFSLYLLSQYIRYKKGDQPDWEMNNLVEIYNKISILNRNVSKQIVLLEEKDASINSLIILNNFAEYVTFTINEKMIDEIEFFVKSFND